VQNHPNCFDRELLLGLHALDQCLYRNGCRRRRSGYGLIVRRGAWYVGIGRRNLTGYSAGKILAGGNRRHNLRRHNYGSAPELVRVLVIDWKSLPRIGMSPGRDFLEALSSCYSQATNHKALPVRQGTSY